MVLVPQRHKAERLRVPGSSDQIEGTYSEWRGPGDMNLKVPYSPFASTLASEKNNVVRAPFTVSVFRVHNNGTVLRFRASLSPKL